LEEIDSESGSANRRDFLDSRDMVLLANNILRY